MPASSSSSPRNRTATPATVALLEAMWPHVDAAARYLESLRQTERTDATLRSADRAFYGLLPASISHEGYSAKPMHSYWDDFWALKGYNGAIAAAVALGRDDDARRLETQRDEFRVDLAASLRARRRRPRHRLSSGRGRARRLRSDLHDDRHRPRRRAASLATRPGARHIRAVLARVRRPARRPAGLGGLHALRAAERQHLHSPGLARPGSRAARLLHGRSSSARRGTSGPR